MSELIPVNIIIADRSYRLKIAPEDEETVRKTVSLINNKIVEFKTGFAGKDMQDYVSMVLLWFATEQTKTGAQLVAMQETSQKLTSLENMLDKLVNETK